MLEIISSLSNYAKYKLVSTSIFKVLVQWLMIYYRCYFNYNTLIVHIFGIIRVTYQD